MKNCLEEISPAVLSEMYFKASAKESDGGIPGRAPYVITKTTYWPLGFGSIDSDHDDFMEGDWGWVVHPDGGYAESIDDYGKTWIIYNGPEDEPFWSTIVDFQKVPMTDTDHEEQEEEEDKRKEKLENFIAIETDELPF